MTQATTWGVPLAAEAPVTPGTMATRMDDCVDALLSSHRGVSRPAYAEAGTVWNTTSGDQLFLFDGTSDFQVAVNKGTPASATATGTAGDVAWDADYFYVCTATDTWKRTALATW